MKLSILATTALLATTFIAAPASADEILGRQYIVLNGGPKPIADNTIYWSPCASVNDCLKTREAFINQVNQIDAYDAYFIRASDKAALQQFKHIVGSDPAYSRFLERMSAGPKLPESPPPKPAWSSVPDFAENYLLSVLKSKPLYTTQTNFEGKFSFNCPTQSCLIYSNGQAGLSVNYWMEVVPVGQVTDLSGSKAIHGYNRSSY